MYGGFGEGPTLRWSLELRSFRSNAGLVGRSRGRLLRRPRGARRRARGDDRAQGQPQGQPDGLGLGQRGGVLVGRRHRARTSTSAPTAIEQSRFRFTGEAKIDKDWSAGYILEIGVGAILRTSGTRTRQIANLNPNNQDNALIVRKSNWYIKSKTLRSDCRRPERHGDLPPARRRRSDSHAQRRRRGRRGDLPVAVPAAP